MEYGPPLLQLRFVLAGRRLVIKGCAARHVGPRTVEASDRVPAAASMWCATLKLQRCDLWHLRKVACDLEVDGRLCSAAFVQVGDAK